MLLSLEEALTVDNTLTVDDLKALEMAIISYSNNHFHRPNYSPGVVVIDGKRLFFEGLNLFQPGDTVELVGVKYLDGFYNVEAVGDGFIEIDTTTIIPLEYSEPGGRMYQVIYPPDVKAGAKHILDYKHTTAKKKGIRSESISRWSVTYADTATGSVMGLPVAEFDFLTPYIKMR